MLCYITKDDYRRPPTYQDFGLALAGVMFVRAEGLSVIPVAPVRLTSPYFARHAAEFVKFDVGRDGRLEWLPLS